MAVSTKLLITNRTLLACQYTSNINSRGYWVGDNPFQYNVPVLVTEIAFIFIFTRTIYVLLRPLKQTRIMTQIIAGIIMGPTLLARIKFYNQNLFPLRVRYILRTLAEFGLVIHQFLLGLQIDVGTLRYIGKRAMTIGLSSTLLSYIVGMLSLYCIHTNQPFDDDALRGIPFMVSIIAVSPFIVITDLLNDLNMLNSDLGRLASSTSMVSDAAMTVYGTLLLSVVEISFSEAATKSVKFILAYLCFYSIMIFVMRPYVIWIANHTPEGKPMKESHFVIIMCVVLGLGFIGTFMGHHPAFVTFVFGLILPDGPPLGLLLSQKLEPMASGLLLPIFSTMSGYRMNIHNFTEKATDKLELIVVMACLAKFIGTILPAMCFDISFFKAITLAFIMSCRGIIEMVIICTWRDEKILTAQMVSILIANMAIITAISTPIVVYLYDPSSRYTSYSRRTILKSKQNHLRILVCINKEENVNPIINLLEVSNPTRSSPVTAFVLQLMELKGSVSAFLKPTHQPAKSCVDSSAHIINAFNQFQRRYNGNVVVQHFTIISPYVSMHDDVCTLALDKRTNILIVPFHKAWGANGMKESVDASIRALNRNVLNKAPCSVGILVDRGLMRANITLITQSTYHIATIFIGGHDDREALAYSSRMAEHPNVSLTVVCFISVDDSYTAGKGVKDLANEVMNEIRTSVVGKKIIYKEEVVKNGMGTLQAIQMLKDSVDLFIVGKHHDPESAVMLGLAEWNESPELGILGNMLVNYDDKFSLLVVQQQPEQTGKYENFRA